MGLLEIFIIGTGLSMDAFAVSIGKGLSIKDVRPADALRTGLWFGGFQALMPLAGYFLGTSFAGLVQDIDHWLAFGLLAFIGVNMIREAVNGKEESVDASFSFRNMLMLSIATSIDALAAGISFAFVNVDIWSAIAVIGVTTFFFSFAGIFLGNIAGSRMNRGAQIFGGIVLIGIGLKILVEHLFFQ